MNSTKGTGDRSASLDPVYRRVEVMREFSDAVHAAFTTLKATLDRIGIADIKSPRPTFHLVRRVWPQDRDAAASFAYSFYAPEALDPDSDVAAKLIERIFQDLDQKLQPPFSTYLDWMREKRNVQAVRQAIKWFEAERTRAQFHEWFEAERTRAQSQGGGGEETLRRNLVHYLLLLFSRTPIDGGIATTLLKEEYRPKGSKELAALPILYVETYRGTSSEGGALPPLRVVPLSGPDENAKPFKTEQDSVSDLPDFFLDIMDPWFREGTLPDPKPGERRVSLSASREGLHMLWLPVFDFVRGDRNAGFFLGWAFQQLWQDANGSNDLTGTPEVLRAMREYAVACRQPFALLSSRLSEQGLREVLAQDPSRDADAVKGAVDSLKRHLYLVQAWDPVDEPGACTPEAGDWCVDGDGRLKVSLGPGRFDDQELFWRERVEDQPPPTIVLTPRAGEFSRPKTDDETECYGQVARRVRVIFSFFQQTLLRLEHERAAEAHRIRGDLVATFSHSFSKVADSVGMALGSISPNDIVDKVQRLLATASEANPKLIAPLVQVRQRLNSLRSDDVNPGVRLYQSYLKPQIQQLNRSVALVERVADHQLDQAEEVPLADLVKWVVTNLLLDVAWNLQVDGVSEVVRALLGDGVSLKQAKTAKQWAFLQYGDSVAGFAVVMPRLTGNGSNNDLNTFLRQCWETVFFELLLNALQGGGLGRNCPEDAKHITIAVERPEKDSEGPWCVLLTNPVAPKGGDADVLSETWTNWEIIRPGAEHGTRGWGCYGVKFLLERVLKSGTLKSERKIGPAGLVMARFKIEINPGWCHYGGGAGGRV